MSKPIQVSKKAYRVFDGARWNALVSLLSTANLDETTPIQRVALLAWVYSSEVLNGGHEQYFVNRNDIDHIEVMEALHGIGAYCQSDVLRSALACHSDARRNMPEGYDEYIAWDERYGYSKQLSVFDQQFYNCRPEIETALLEAHLDRYESQFIKWVP